MACRRERRRQIHERSGAVSLRRDRTFEARLGFRVVAGAQQRETFLERRLAGGIDAFGEFLHDRRTRRLLAPKHRRHRRIVDRQKELRVNGCGAEPFRRRHQHFRRGDFEAARRGFDRAAAGGKNRPKKIFAGRKLRHRHHAREDDA